MRPSSPIADRSDTPCSRWLAAGSVQARISLLASRPATPPSDRKLCNSPLARSQNPMSIAEPTAATASILSRKSDPAAKIPIAPAAPPLHHPPRFRALALLGRRRPEHVESSSSRRPRNLHISGSRKLVNSAEECRRAVTTVCLRAVPRREGLRDISPGSADCS
jgi:hypothetical protein